MGFMGFMGFVQFMGFIPGGSGFHGLDRFEDSTGMIRFVAVAGIHWAESFPRVFV